MSSTGVGERRRGAGRTGVGGTREGGDGREELAAGGEAGCRRGRGWFRSLDRPRSLDMPTKFKERRRIAFPSLIVSLLPAWVSVSYSLFLSVS